MIKLIIKGVTEEQFELYFIEEGQQNYIGMLFDNNHYNRMDHLIIGDYDAPDKESWEKKHGLTVENLIYQIRETRNEIRYVDGVVLYKNMDVTIH